MRKKARKRPVPHESQNTDFWDLKLYVMDETPRSRHAIENLNAICEEYLKGRCKIRVIDIMRHPEIAIKDQITAVPAVVREYPLKRMIGDLSNKERVMAGLDIRRSPTEASCR